VGLNRARRVLVGEAMNKLALLSLVALVSTTGCAVRMSRPDAPPPPPGRKVQQMNHDDAVGRAMAWARDRGYDSHLKEAHRTGNGVWKVKLEVARHDAHGKVHIDLDAYTWEIIRAQEKVKYQKAKYDKPKHHEHGASAVGAKQDKKEKKGKDKKHRFDD
jgi:hypothetical protein